MTNTATLRADRGVRDDPLAGGATDPDSGPLLALLALAYWPANTASGKMAKMALGKTVKAVMGKRVRS